MFNEAFAFPITVDIDVVASNDLLPIIKDTSNVLHEQLYSSERPKSAMQVEEASAFGNDQMSNKLAKMQEDQLTKVNLESIEQNHVFIKNNVSLHQKFLKFQQINDQNIDNQNIAILNQLESIKSENHHLQDEIVHLKESEHDKETQIGHLQSLLHVNENELAKLNLVLQENKLQTTKEITASERLNNEKVEKHKDDMNQIILANAKISELESKLADSLNSHALLSEQLEQEQARVSHAAQMENELKELAILNEAMQKEHTETLAQMRELERLLNVDDSSNLPSHENISMMYESIVSSTNTGINEASETTLLRRRIAVLLDDFYRLMSSNEELHVKLEKERCFNLHLTDQLSTVPDYMAVYRDELDVYKAKEQERDNHISHMHALIEKQEKEIAGLRNLFLQKPE